MKVTQVAICPTEASKIAGRPALTPELLAASGARYSRNNEGLDAILGKIDPDNLEKSVDSIFRMIDYGHQSIADMAPVAIFIDEISIFLAYLVWSWCPTAGGQESSTRYIRLDPSGLVDPDLFGLPNSRRAEWLSFMHSCFESYGRATNFWESLGAANPELARIPGELANDPSEKAKKQVARMRRNYAFDRARYFLPVAAKTNMMLVMSSRAWVQLIQNLLSHWLPEAIALGAAIKTELQLSAPRMVRHAEEKASFMAGHLNELARLQRQATQSVRGEAPCDACVQVMIPPGIGDAELALALEHHHNRYDFIGSDAARTSIRFSWSAVAIAEIRDLNRHRTGTKHCPLIPRGFYCALDQMPNNESLAELDTSIGDQSVAQAVDDLRGCRVSFPAWFVLGTQFSFEHTTTLDKYTYEAELRTGTGAHFRYAQHLRDSINALRKTLPTFASSVTLGQAEPE
jgi:thymidylate synthase ThyX